MTSVPSKLSKLKPPARIGTTTITAIKGTNLPQSTKENIQPRPIYKPALRTLSRRSKSVSDLRSAAILLSTKPIEPLKKTFLSSTRSNLTTSKVHLTNKTISATTSRVNLNLNKTTTASTLRTAAKRPATTAPVHDIKPKVTKPAVISKFDYKGRFNALKEKHTSLLESRKDVDEKLSIITAEHSNKLELIEKIEKELNSSKKRVETLEHDIKTTTDRNNELESILKDCQSKINKLTSQVQEYKANCTNLNEQCERLQVKTTQIDLELQKEKEANKCLEKECAESKDKIEFFKGELKHGEDERRVLHNNIQDLKGNIRIYCRVRPKKYDEDERCLCNFSYIDENTLELKKSKESVMNGKMGELKQEFCFDRVFAPNSTQAEVFEDLSQLVQSALDGYHVCVFAYGQTGSGKTYTMQGVENNLGMIPRAIDLLFERIEHLQKLGWNYEVEVSFLEIYNETIKDLLEPRKQNLEIYYNEGKGTTVKNLKIVEVKSAAMLKKMMHTAQTNRAVASTDFNEHSSRSHAVTKITVTGHHDENQISYIGSLNLVDLAGSESAKTSSSDRIEETKNINKSLSNLGTVMLALHNKDNHIPYRNSKLTFLLQTCLGGNSKTLMFVNVAPFEECYNETINSLRFASKVKQIKNTIRKNKTFK